MLMFWNGIKDLIKGCYDINDFNDFYDIYEIYQMFKGLTWFKGWFMDQIS